MMNTNLGGVSDLLNWFTSSQTESLLVPDLHRSNQAAVFDLREWPRRWSTASFRDYQLRRIGA